MRCREGLVSAATPLPEIKLPRCPTRCGRECVFDFNHTRVPHTKCFLASKRSYSQIGTQIMMDRNPNERNNPWNFTQVQRRCELDCLYCNVSDGLPCLGYSVQAVGRKYDAKRWVCHKYGWAPNIPSRPAQFTAVYEKRKDCRNESLLPTAVPTVVPGLDCSVRISSLESLISHMETGGNRETPAANTSAPDIGGLELSDYQAGCRRNLWAPFCSSVSNYRFKLSINGTPTTRNANRIWYSFTFPKPVRSCACE